MWMFDENHQPFIIPHDSINIEYPVMVEAYLTDDMENAVSVDRVELKYSFQNKALSLPKGREYIIQIFNPAGEEKEWKINH